MTTKTIGYFTMFGGALLLLVGLSLIIHKDLTATILIGLGALVGGAGYYIAKKQPQLPGVK